FRRHEHFQQHRSATDVPQMVTRASAGGGCRSATNSSLWQTFFNSFASCKMSSEAIVAAFRRAKKGKLQMACLSAEDLKEESRRKPQDDYITWVSLTRGERRLGGNCESQDRRRS